MITTIVLDWGGVLNLTGHASLISKQIQEKYDIPYMKIIEVIVPLWKKLNRALIGFDDLISGVNDQLNIKISNVEMVDFLENSFDLNYELISLLKKLKPKYSLIILSNNNDQLVNAIKSAHPDLYGLFNKHYYSYELNLRKPDIEIFNYFLKDAGLNPSECLLIDDTEENITISEKLGMKGIIYKDNDQLKRELASLRII